VTVAGRLGVVVAPDSFKGSLTAAEAADAIATGLRSAGGGLTLDLLERPVADGGEGTVAMLLAAGWRPRHRRVQGPIGAPVRATYALSPAGDPVPTAVVELATAARLSLLAGGPDPLGASTYGVGELVAAALDDGVGRLVLGIGDSASTDGGTGLATALGVRFLDDRGCPLAPGGGALGGLHRVDVSGLDPRLRAVEVVVATDVDNPLTGLEGAARVYGPQKGATAQDVEVLEMGLARLAAVVRRNLGTDVEHVAGAGAAGGVGAGALAFLGARLTPGIDLLLDLVGFDEAIAGKDLVVTGEGSVDAQTLSGKAPLGVARRAHAAGVPVLVVAGRTDLSTAGRATLADLGVVSVRAMLDIEPDPGLAHRDAARLLAELSARAFAELVPDLTTSRSPA
jgi:glycerate 2-kinase